jgi:G:T-mismatch repair DNA endonuclease (very short patch repair protein)
LERNVARDVDHQMTLKSKGWKTMVIWECETADMKDLARRLQRFLGKRRLKE